MTPKKSKTYLHIQTTDDVPNIVLSVAKNFLCAHIHNKFIFFQKHFRKQLEPHTFITLSITLVQFTTINISNKSIFQL